jgi:hypothetical protein
MMIRNALIAAYYYYNYLIIVTIMSQDESVCELISSELDHRGPVPRRSRDCHHYQHAQTKGNTCIRWFQSSHISALLNQSAWIRVAVRSEVQTLTSWVQIRTRGMDVCQCLIYVEWRLLGC